MNFYTHYLIFLIFYMIGVLTEYIGKTIQNKDKN
jgi:hypothetical protein